MITRPALCPAGSTFWNKTPESQLPINRISSSFFFAPHLLASLKAIECSTGPSIGTNISKLSKLNFASGRTGRMAGPASSTLVKLSLRLIYTSVLVEATRIVSIQVVHLNMKVARLLHSRRSKATSDYV